MAKGNYLELHTYIYIFKHLFFSISHNGKAYQVILTKALQRIRPKNLTPWRDSNLGSFGLGAVAMTTLPRRQGCL
jgi:hypothetical protein